LFVTIDEDNWLVDTGAHVSYFQDGSLPDLLGMTLLLANTQGIIGNEIMMDQAIIFSPRLKKLVFRERS